jgi:tRNA pseudouridine55 synthase
MSRRRKGRDIHGVLLLDKPAGFSSNQAVQKVRWLFQARKAGHTGTLDPFATGMLPICLGEASKTAGFMLDSAKTYTARARLGQATSTGDIEGDIIEEVEVPAISRSQAERELSGFEGPSEQVPPMYSALKHKGEPLYKLARAGQQVERDPRPIVIHSIELLSWEPPEFEFRVTCSKGTYIRVLAEDIGRALGSCAHLLALRRLSTGPFQEQAMVSLEELERRTADGSAEDLLKPVDAGLADWPVATLDEAATQRFTHGNPVPHEGKPGTLWRVYGSEGLLLGIGESTDSNVLKPKRIMNLPT